MNWSLIQPSSLALLFALFAGANQGIGQETNTTGVAAGPASLLESFEGKSWATLASDGGGYRLRLLTDEEKVSVEQTIRAYREPREPRERGDEQAATAYRALPSDLRNSNLYRIRRLGSSDLELKRDGLHAIMPLSSIRLVLIGPQGSLGSGDRSYRGSSARSARPSPQDFIEALRGGGGRSGGFNSSGAAAGLLGSAVQPGKAADKERAESTPIVFFLKYAAADSVVDIIAGLYGESEIRIALEPRLNAVIVQCDPKMLEKIESLIESLDRESVNEPDEPAELATLRVYSLEETDGATIVDVLQTLLAGRPDVRLSLDIRMNRVIVLGDDVDHEIVKETIAEFESAK